jgi:hypothetical protein
MKIKIEKEYFYIIVFLLILIPGVFVVDALGVIKTGAWHDDNAVEIIIDSQTMSLQEAIDQGKFTENLQAGLECKKEMIEYETNGIVPCGANMFLVGGGVQFNSESLSHLKGVPIIDPDNRKKLAWQCEQNNPDSGGDAICCKIKISEI